MTGRTTDKRTERSPSGPPLERIEAMVAELTGLYGQLDALSQRQTELVGGVSLDPLLEILSERRPIVDRIDAVAGELGPLLADRDAVAAAAGERANELRQRLAGIERMAATVNERDETDRAVLLQRRQAVSDELTEIGTARAAVRAYGSPGDPSPRMQDRRG